MGAGLSKLAVKRQGDNNISAELAEQSGAFLWSGQVERVGTFSQDDRRVRVRKSARLPDIPAGGLRQPIGEQFLDGRGGRRQKYPPSTRYLRGKALLTSGNGA